MQLIDALVMVAQEYPEDTGWLILNSEHGRITKAPAPLSAHYMAYDATGVFIRGNMALEIVLAALVERDPVAARDEHWKIAPYTMQGVVSSAMDLLASHARCTGEHQWNTGDPIRVCVKCGFFEVVQKEHQP